MTVEDEGDSDRFVSEMADIIRRIKGLHAIIRDGAMADLSPELDGTWTRVHALLIALHERVAEGSDDQTLSSLLLRVDRELATMEALVRASPPCPRCGSLH